MRTAESGFEAVPGGALRWLAAACLVAPRPSRRPAPRWPPGTPSTTSPATRQHAPRLRLPGRRRRELRHARRDRRDRLVRQHDRLLRPLGERVRLRPGEPRATADESVVLANTGDQRVFESANIPTNPRGNRRPTTTAATGSTWPAARSRSRAPAGSRRGAWATSGGVGDLPRQAPAHDLRRPLRREPRLRSPSTGCSCSSRPPPTTPRSRSTSTATAPPTPSTGTATATRGPGDTAGHAAEGPDVPPRPARSACPSGTTHARSRHRRRDPGHADPPGQVHRREPRTATTARAGSAPSRGASGRRTTTPRSTSPRPRDRATPTTTSTTRTPRPSPSTGRPTPSSGSFTIPAGDHRLVPGAAGALPVDSGLYFKRKRRLLGRRHRATRPGQTYEWGYSLLPSTFLYQEHFLGWAPGAIPSTPREPGQPGQAASSSPSPRTTPGSSSTTTTTAPPTRPTR